MIHSHLGMALSANTPQGFIYQTGFNLETWHGGAEQQRGAGVQAVGIGTALLQALEPGRFEAGKCLASKKQFDVNSDSGGKRKKRYPTFLLMGANLCFLHVSC